jgi:hypothetical protein
MVLNTIPGVIEEQCRIYRSCTNGHLKPSDMCRMMFSLREIRNSLESLPLAPPAETPTTLNVVEVPSSYFVRSVEGLSTSIGPLTLEHRPAEEPIAAETEPRSPQEAKLLAALEAMDPEELLDRLSNVLVDHE